jgi:hypothetical protein
MITKDDRHLIILPYNSYEILFFKIYIGYLTSSLYKYTLYLQLPYTNI